MEAHAGKEIELVIFDVDGTLSDSMGVIVAAWGRAIREAGLGEPDPAQVRHRIGRSIEEGFRELFPGAAPSEYDRFASCYRDVYRAMVEGNEPPLYERVRETLETLRNAGRMLAIATGKSRAGLARTLRAHRLDEYFIATRTADQARSKPDPDMLIQLLEATGVPSARAVMVGDTTFDLQMARAAGVKAAGVTYGAHSRDGLLPCAPDALLDRVDQILPWLGLQQGV